MKEKEMTVGEFMDRLLSDGGYAVLGDSRRALERLLAKIWDNKCEQDKLFLIIDRATGMTPDKLLKKYRDNLYKREPGDFA